ncbi:pyridoxamine 5'-phosphate oxidase family protein [Actinoplanes sp. NPDC051859]|uniref:pyridoxamine 5'-phosphate oxidase family protein n=1 Tax=Actinoplanes sp. NPDC051859 TaxID=3363909 RepID=UPI003787726A
MTSDEPRTKVQRKADVLAKLNARVVDAWVATASDGRPHLVPLTLAWHDDRIVLATDRNAPTARALEAQGTARLALGHTRDVVLIDAVREQTVPVAEAQELGAVYAAQNDWDPRTAGPDYVFLVLRPDRIQAWREVNELPGRTLMRSGTWVI